MPDLSYIASQLAQYSRKPTAENLLDLKRAQQFFISTPNIGLCYSTVTTPSFNLVGYMDADHAADPDNRRSRTGFLFRLEPTGPISWNSQKQELVALSSAEAEFIAATAAVREGLYLQELLQEEKFQLCQPFTCTAMTRVRSESQTSQTRGAGYSAKAEIYVDAMAAQKLRWLIFLLNDLGVRSSTPLALFAENKAMIPMSREPRLESRVKHIDVRQFFLRELQQRGHARLDYMESAANIADIFTKALPPGDHHSICLQLDLVKAGPRLL
ncbi:unnamed protein product [Closterium sp. NIES-53]